MPFFGLDDAVVVVTGGANGVGRAYCAALIDVGARVVVADIDGDAARRAAAEWGPERAIGVEADVSEQVSAQRLAKAAVEAFERIDGLVNNAALMSALPRRCWEDIPVEEWDAVMAVNVRGPFLCCRAVVPLMRRQGRGKIVNISSSRVWEGTPNRLHYTSSKAALIGFTRSLAREVGADGITVNAVTPGLTRTSAQTQTSEPGYLESQERSGRAIPRAQVPGDLVGAVLFLLSPASDYITGQTLNVDGGKAMH